MSAETPYWVLTIPVLSTACLTNATYGDLSSLVIQTADTLNGCFVELWDGNVDREAAYPEDLRAVAKWAAEHGHRWLRLDAYGDLPEGLPDHSETWK